MFETFLLGVQEHIVNPIIILLFALAAAYFLWGVLVYIKNAENDTERLTGQRHMIWGVVGMAIMLSAFGIINLISDFLNVNVTVP